MDNLEIKASGAFDVVIEIPATVQLCARIEADTLEEAHVEGRAFALGLDVSSKELELISLSTDSAFIPHCSRVGDEELARDRDSFAVQFYENDKGFSERAMHMRSSKLTLADAERLLTAVTQGKSCYSAASLHKGSDTVEVKSVVNRFGLIFVATLAKDGVSADELLKGWYTELSAAKLAALDFVLTEPRKVAVFVKSTYEDEPVASVVLSGGD